MPNGILYKSLSSSSGRAVAAACCISNWYWAISSGSTWTVGGARDTSATKSYKVLASDIELSVKPVASAQGSEGTIIPKPGCQSTFSPAIGKASQNCSLTWQRCRSTEGFSCDGR